MSVYVMIGLDTPAVSTWRLVTTEQ